MERPDKRPKMDLVVVQYLSAYGRLCSQSPVPVTEIMAYHDRFELPYSVAGTIDLIRELERDDINARIENAKQQEKNQSKRQGMKGWFKRAR